MYMFVKPITNWEEAYCFIQNFSARKESTSIFFQIMSGNMHTRFHSEL